MDNHVNSNPNKDKYRQLSIYLTESFLFMNQFEWISNSYVAEFFTQHLWERLPLSWRTCFENIPLETFAWNVLKYRENKRYNTVWPLSLLSFVATCHALALNRQQTELCKNEPPLPLSNTFKKHIKPKKQHELSLLPQLIHHICQTTGAKNIVDVGSGLGHLARFLAYKYGYNVTAVEMTSQQLPVAEKFDKEMEKELQRISERAMEGRKCLGKVTHIAKQIDADISSEEFCALVNSCEEGSRCVVIGLHTCGDLASTMLRVFHSTPLICGLVSVSCCYFRMTLQEEHFGTNEITSLPVAEEQNTPRVLYNTFTSSSLYSLIHNINNFGCQADEIRMRTSKLPTTNTCGFPLSSFLQNIPCQPLKYKSFETACHFIDDYSQKILSNSPNLKLHCYRAVMEVLLRQIDPTLILTPVRCKKIKNAASMDFSEYAENVMRRVKKEFHSSMLTLIDCEDLLSRWKCVVIYHSLAILLGTVIESIALVDKCMFLLESDCNVSLVPLFDPTISPRNLVVIATRKNEDYTETESYSI